MKRAGVFALVLTAVIAAAALFMPWNTRFLWNRSGSSPLADMPEKEFAKNPSLSMPDEPLPLEAPLTAEGYLALLSELSEPDRLLWDGTITVMEGESSRSFSAVYRKEGDQFLSELLEHGVVRRGLKRDQGRLTLTVNGASVSVPESDATTPLAAIGMMDVSTLLKLPPESLTCRYEVLDGEQTVSIRYQDSELPLEERCWISLYYAIPLRVETWQGESLTYLAQTTSLQELPPSQEESPFS